jgi:hypothetical protein
MTEEQLYTKLYTYLSGLFPADSAKIVRGFQNQSPMPQNAIIYTLLPFTQDLDQAQYWNEDDESTVQGSKLQMLQVDFYGATSYDKVMKLFTLWRSPYTTDRLTEIQPLYANSPRGMDFVNEQNQYEKRFMLEVALQYNPYYTYAEDSIINLSSPTITTT